MKSKLIVLLSIFGMTTGFGRPANGLIRSEGDSATVTFKVNTAFVQDTLTPGSVVSFRGTAFGGDWSLEKGFKFKNVGGDYWEAEKKVPLGSSGGTFKIVTQTETGTGWDRHDQSAFIIENDTTIELFTTGLKETYTDPVTGTEITRGDDWNPLELAKNGDTSVFAVHFRVNMQGVFAFNPTKHTATVRGSFNGWSAADTLKPESRHDDLSGVYGAYESEKYLFSKTILIPKASAGILKYKFVWSDSGAISTNWEDKIGGDRTIQLGRDTTLAWKWFDNTAPIICIDDIFFQIVLNVDLEKAISANGFNPQTDTLIAVAGFLGTASRPVEFELHPSSGTVYSGSDSVSSGFNSTVFYKYFKKSGSIRIEESYLDFNDPKTSRSAPLYRKIVMPSIGVSVSGWDIDKSEESSHRQPVFRSSVPMTDSTQVILHVDLRPVFFFVKRLGDSLSYSPPVSRYYLTEKNIDLQRVFCASPTYCWMCMGPWAPPEMNDKGLDGDKIAGDSVYSITMKVKKGELSSVEYQLAFGWMPNESSFLNTRFHNLDPKPVNEFSFQFGDIEPDRYKNDKGFWDFNSKKGVVTSVNDFQDSEIPKKIKISAYPNPFNPATLITYSIPQSGKVSLKVFDLLGRQVALLAEEIKPAGTHQIPFRGDDLASGIYIVRMESGSKTESVKVILLK